MIANKKIGIKQARETVFMSVSELAKRLNVDNSVVRAWENGVSSIPIPILIKISKILKVPIEQLLFSETRKPLDLSQLNEEQTRIVLSLYRDFKTNEEVSYGHS